MKKDPLLIGLVLDEQSTLTLGEFSCACAMRAEWVISLVEEGILEPQIGEVGGGEGVTGETEAGEVGGGAGVGEVGAGEVVDEVGADPTGEATRMRFAASTLRRARRVMRLQRDLGVNLSGAALALELMDEIDALRAQLRVLDSQESD